MTKPVTPDFILLRLVEAASTLRRLPIERNGRPSGYRIYWPDIVRDTADAYGWYGDPGWVSPAGDIAITRDAKKRNRPGPPAPDAIERMDETLMWLWHAEEADWPLLWFKAMFPNRGFTPLAARAGVSPRTLNRRWQKSVLDVAVAVTERQAIKVTA